MIGGAHHSTHRKKGRIKTNLNAIALTLNIYEYLTEEVDYQKLITPKTPIQKEIEEKRKEIEKLKKQKADMEELDRLKIEESELFWEVNDPEESTGPHFKWCAVCTNYYSGERCDCLDKRDDDFVWVPISKDEMRFKRVTYKMKDPLATHVEECPYCSAHSFEWEYKTDGMIQTCRNCETEVGMIKTNSPIKETMK